MQRFVYMVPLLASIVVVVYTFNTRVADQLTSL